MLTAAAVLAACDEHRDFPDDSLKAGQVLCSDGSVMDLPVAESLGRMPVAVVFHVNRDTAVAGEGYAVWLHDMAFTAFADTLGVEQGTSADPAALDGNENTYRMYVSECGSPVASCVFDVWTFGQSAYIPSVAQMRLLRASLDVVNPVIGDCGGDSVCTVAGDCWYWTSTEVSGQQRHKAWLFSHASGAVQETPKNERHAVRPIVTINR